MLTLVFVLLFLTIPIGVLMFAKHYYHRDISWREFAVGIALEAFLLTLLYVGGVYLKGADLQILNGKVVEKYRDPVPCEHSYECNCTTDDDGNTSCQTCYEHVSDYDWVVNTTVGKLKIDRVDRQGVHTPPRFEAVQLGEPASLEDRYMNYIKASGRNLYTGAEIEDEPLISYPRVFDYYRANHVMEYGRTGIDLKDFNDRWAKILASLSPRKQANVLLVFTTMDPAKLKESVEIHWAKKNDVVIFFKVVDGTITYIDASAMSKTSLYLQLLREKLLGVSVLDAQALLSIVEQSILNGYERRPMEEFSYLKYSISPPWWVFLLMGLVSFGGSIGLVFLFREADW